MDHPDLVTIFGGSGFVGTQVVQLLARAGYRVRVAVRRPDLAGHVRPLGGVGQVVPIQANVRNRDSVAAAVRGASVVINLASVGIEKGKQRFRAINVMGERNVAEASVASKPSLANPIGRLARNAGDARHAAETASIITSVQVLPMRPNVMCKDASSVERAE